MGTKLKPGAFDCYANAAPDEPMFVLLARDESAPALVRKWVDLRAARKGLTEPDDKELEALACADAMERWQASTSAPSDPPAPTQRKGESK